MSNLSVLEQNICLGIESEEAQAIFLRWKDRDVLKAERCAWGWDILAPWMDFLLPLADRTLREQRPDNPHFVATSEKAISELRTFMRTRHERRHFPGH
jgi:hypothetical protein